ncbi:MAG: hypothetical protein R3A46_08950 [Thermomicrobiales bacterium]
MSDAGDKEIERTGPEEQTDIHDSRGTFIILLAYLVVIVGLWGTVYFTLLSRG